MADEKKTPEKKPAAALGVEMLSAALRDAQAGDLPAVECADGVVTLHYPGADLHAARVSADVEALRALPGYVLAESAQVEHRASPALPVAAATVVARLVRAG